MGRKTRVSYQIRNSWRTWVTGSTKPAFTSNSANGYQCTDSVTTAWPSLSGKGLANHLDIGSNFFTVRPYFIQEAMWSGVANTGLYNFEGDMVALPPVSSSALLTLSAADRNEMYRRGSIAISKCKPLNPVVDGVTALAELRKDGLPKIAGQELLEKRGKDLVKSTGSEYLNIEFALKPLVSDMMNLRKAAMDQGKIISQLHRDSGKLIRRSFSFPPETTESSTTVSGSAAAPYPALVSQFYSSTSWVKTTTTKVTKTYRFSGAFTYYIAPDDSRLHKMVRMAQEAKSLYGIRISPEVAYNLTPWSWALDWVSNTGDLVSNISSFSQDGLVMAYGYVQCHTVSETTVTVRGGAFKGGIANEYITRYGFESKARVKATPFGFGLNPALFSNRQWSIIGALGMTKAPKTLP